MTQSSVLTALLAVLSTGLSVALLDLVVAANTRPIAPSSTAAFFLPLLACALACSAAYACIALLLLAAPLPSRLVRRDSVLLAGAVIVVLPCLVYLINPADLAWPGGFRRMAAGIALGLAFFPVVCLALESLTRFPRARDAIIHACLSGPVFLAEAFLFQWAGHEWLSGRVAGAIFTLLLFAGVVFGTLRFFAWPASFRRVLSAVGVLWITLIAGSAWATWRNPVDVHEAASAARAPIRHIVLLTIDTLRRDALSVYGGAIPTPNLDALAADSILFTNAYSPAPWTLPSFVSIFTGVSPWVHKTTRQRHVVPAGLPTLARRLAESGYLTSGIGYNCNLTPRASRGVLNRGLAEYNFYSKYSSPRTAALGFLIRRYPDGFGLRATTDDLTELARNWVHSHQSFDFFFWLHYLDPHLPYSPPASFYPAGPPYSEIGPEHDLESFTRFRAGLLPPTPEAEAWLTALYGGEVTYVDDRIGSFISTLKEAGIYEDALIVLSSDHGEELLDHSGVDHGHTLYNELLRVPLAFKLPGSIATGKIDAVVPTVSILPTILDLCAVDFSAESLSGRSLVPYWDSGSTKDQLIFSTGTAVFEERESVVFDGWKYIHSLASGREKLYNLGTDPSERLNLSGADQGRITQARALLKANQAHSERLRKHYGLKTPAEGVQLTEAERRLLRSLGYVQ